MTGWLLSIVGIVFMGVLFDLIYPNGKTNSLCKSIFAVLSLFVMVSPILKLDIDNIKVDNFNNQQLIEHINDAKINSIKLKIDSHLSSCGIVGVVVKIDSNLTNEEFEIEKIYIDTTNLVLTENITNINKYVVIINEVSNLLDIEKERIVVYG